MNTRPQIFRTLVVSSCAALLFSVPVRSDEGMWTFDNPPLKQLQEKYHFTPTPQWLDHIRLSCVRLNDGGSGSFVSPHGLLLSVPVRSDEGMWTFDNPPLKQLQEKY